MLRAIAAAALALVAGAGTSGAREFWIAPEAYSWPADSALRADIRLGEDFMGEALGFVPEDTRRFEIITADGAVPVRGHDGDLPALMAADLPEGLAVVVHEATSLPRMWDVWESFADYALMRGVEQVAEFARTPTVEEDCVRLAKSLVALGHGRGADALTGLRAEFVALANPYVDDLAGVLPVQFHLDGAPRGNVPVRVHMRRVDAAAVGGMGPATVVETYRTDTNGIVVLPVRPGTQYLVSAVTFEPPRATDDETDDGTDDAGAARRWRTLWTSLTFEVPATRPAP
jgi:hypothetical protein